MRTDLMAQNNHKFSSFFIPLYMCLLLFLFTSCSLIKKENTEDPWAYHTLICPPIEIYSNEKIEFTDTEKRLICGDPEDIAYAKVPLNQAEFLARGFLQSRGYLAPFFREALKIYTGPQSQLKTIRLIPGNKAIQAELYSAFKNAPLNPKLLNQIEGQTKKEFRTRGYPCIKVISKVEIPSSTVIVDVQNLRLSFFGTVKRNLFEELTDSALLRFYPFESTDLFNEDKLILTDKRLNNSNIVQGSYFQEQCSENGISLTHKFILGPPRTFRFGLGMSTEQGPYARVRWTHHRFLKMASNIDVLLRGSLKIQSLGISSEYFFWPEAPRRSLYAQLLLNRESQDNYEEIHLKLPVAIKWTRDVWDHHLSWSLGPSFSRGFFNQKNKNENKNYTTGALEAHLKWMSHSYEFYDIHPEEGRLLDLRFEYWSPLLGFSHDLLKANFSHREVYQLLPFDKGHVIAAWRLLTGTTWTKIGTSLKDIPPSMKFYSGGSDEVRGFTPVSLPENNGQGAFTQLVQGFELRKTHFFFPPVEGLIFLDAGLFGEKTLNIQPTLYWSTGFGLRYLSPIGLLYGFTAWRYKEFPYANLGPYFFVGLGGEF